jgi:hypothetical protein
MNTLRSSEYLDVGGIMKGEKKTKDERWEEHRSGRQGTRPQTLGGAQRIAALTDHLSLLPLEAR